MSENDSTVRKERRAKRFGLTRFIVPHESFDWFTRGVGIAALSASILLIGAMCFYQVRLFEALGMFGLAERPDLLDRYVRLSLISNGVMVISAALYITMMAAYFFHRIAGPIYRMQIHMQSVIDGEPVEELRLRKTDQLSELCEKYNQLLHTLDAIEPKPLNEANPLDESRPMNQTKPLNDKSPSEP
jgi:hypothetical protein